MEPENRRALSPGLLLALAFGLSLAGAALWPSTEWAAEYEAAEAAREQCRLHGLRCETEAKPRRPKTGSCGVKVGSSASPWLSVSAPRWRI